jgi:anti-anti-sigma regulatory factor
VIIEGCDACRRVAARLGEYPFSPGRPAGRCPGCGAPMRYVTLQEAIPMRTGQHGDGPSEPWHSEPDGGRHTLRLVVEDPLDLLMAGLLRRRLTQLVDEGVRDIVLDVSRVAPLDDAVSSYLAATATRLGWRNGCMTIVPASDDRADRFTRGVGTTR